MLPRLVLLCLLSDSDLVRCCLPCPLSQRMEGVVKGYGCCHHGNCRAHKRIPDVTGGMCCVPFFSFFPPFFFGRWEAHIWVKELGRQVYLGGYEHEEHAAEAYDVAALKCKGFRVKTNFDADRYAQHGFTAWLALHHCAVLLRVCTDVEKS